MKNYLKKIVIPLLVVIGSAAVLFLLLHFIVKTPVFSKVNSTKDVSVSKVKTVKATVNYVAIGDSLTYGIGDETKAGGYVPLVNTTLSEKDETKLVATNYGVSGDTSTQVYTRIKKQKKIQESLAAADIITMTVGANDLMHVINKNILDMDLVKVKKGQKVYQENVTKLIKEIRKYNTDAPLVVASIYNPFYVYFPQITDMTKSMNSWNETTKTVLKSFKQTYFVDIDSVMTNPKGSILATNKAGKAAYNPFLYTTDHFHPNNRGYQAMANKLIVTIQKIKQYWLYK